MDMWLGLRWWNWVSDGVDGGGMMLAWRCAMLRFWEGSAKYGDLAGVTCRGELGAADWWLSWDLKRFGGDVIVLGCIRGGSLNLG